MSKWDKALKSVMSGQQDAGIRFDDLSGLLLRMGYDVRVKGSHHIYQKAGSLPVNPSAGQRHGQALSDSAGQASVAWS